MIDRDEAELLLDGSGRLVSVEGVIVGPVARVYLDEYTGWPSFATTRLADTATSTMSDAASETLVALHEAVLRPDRRLEVPYTQARIESAPTVAADRDLTISEEDALFEYYEVPIDGVTPVVEHLGSVLVAHGHGDDTHVVEHDVDRPTS